MENEDKKIKLMMKYARTQMELMHTKMAKEAEQVNSRMNKDYLRMTLPFDIATTLLTAAGSMFWIFASPPITFINFIMAVTIYYALYTSLTRFSKNVRSYRIRNEDFKKFMGEINNHLKEHHREEPQKEVEHQERTVN